MGKSFLFKGWRGPVNKLYSLIMSFTYNPKKVKRAKKHGFLSRSRTSYGKRVLKKRMQKGRKRLSTV